MMFHPISPDPQRIQPESAGLSIEQMVDAQALHGKAPCEEQVVNE